MYAADHASECPAARFRADCGGQYFTRSEQISSKILVSFSIEINRRSLYCFSAT